MVASRPITDQTNHFEDNVRYLKADIFIIVRRLLISTLSGLPQTDSRARPGPPQKTRNPLDSVFLSLRMNHFSTEMFQGSTAWIFRRKCASFHLMGRACTSTTRSARLSSPPSMRSPPRTGCFAKSYTIPAVGPLKRYNWYLSAC